MGKTVDTLTTQDLMEIFEVSHVTISSWCAGTQKRKPLPQLAQTGGATKRSKQFSAKAVTKWAKQHDLVLHQDPASVARNWALASKVRGKPGPKTRASQGLVA